jgi:protein-disulfide isomerase
MSGIGRRDVVLGAAAMGAALAAGCSNNNPATPAASPDDMAIGLPNAPVTMIEYASVMCPICKAWHDAMWAQFKQHYIDTGKVRFIMREFPTGDMAPSVVVAAFQVARCGNATPEQYFSRVDVFYDQQPAFFATGGQNELVRQKLVDIGKAANLSEQQVMDCINDPSGGTRMQRLYTAGSNLGVSGTPTLFLNGRKLDPTPGNFSELSHVVDAAVSGH